MGIGTLDWIVVAIYFAIVISIAVWAILKERKGEETSADYFLAGRNIGWFVVGASLFASNIGSEHLVGLAGTGAASGLVMGQLELQASLILLLLGWVFVPFYIRSGVFTMPEFLERRYSPAARWYLSIVAVIGYVLTKISVTIYAGGVVFESLMGISFWTGAIVVVVITGIYTVLGGLRAVVYTDMMQAFVLILGAGLVTLTGLARLGGWGAMVEAAEPGFFNIWKAASHPDFPWTGMAFGAPIIAIWYWCTDQFIVQRTLSARGIDDARRGTIFAGILKQLPIFIFVVPGVIAYCLAKSGEIELASPDQALPTLVVALLPVGLRGLVVAGLIAALMSSLSSVFNSCSTLITLDIYKKLHPEASERRLVIVGQSATVVLVLLGLAWIPLMANISGVLYQYLQSVQAYISPPIAAVFLLGLFWKRLNAAGAMASLLSGFALGMLRLVLELNKDGLTGILHSYATINFLNFAAILFLICSAILVLVSLLTKPPSDEHLKGLTFATASERVEGIEPIEEVGDRGVSDPAWRRMDARLSVIVVTLVKGVHMPLVDLRSQATPRSAEELVGHLESFELDLKFTAGIWFFSPFDSRFHDKYKADLNLEQRLEIAASLKPYGLSGLEAHYPNEVNEENVDLWQAFARDTGIRLVTVIPLLFYDPVFEFGSLSSPLPDARAQAIDRAKRSLALAKQIDADFSVVWAGIDGYENPIGIDFVGMRRRFAEGLAEAMDAVPGVRIAFEPKPYEPRGRILYGLTPEGVLLGHDVEAMLGAEENRELLDQGHKLVCMNPEIGHVLMGFEDLPYALSWPLGEGRLAHTHWNSQPLGNYDQDLNVGVVSPEQMEAGLYVLKMHGYTGYFGIDVNPERMPVDVAIKNSMDALRAANDRINGYDHERILEATERPDAHRGWLEAYLIRQRSRGASLPPIEEAIRTEEGS
jgi:SSS family solute:Na+ symporter